MALTEWLSIQSLKGCRLKIKRADTHIENLSTEIAAFLKGNPQAVVGKFDEQSGHYVLTATGESDVADFAICAGEVTHQLRSSLDHLACRLVVANRQPLRKQTAFPIYISDPTKSSEVNVLRDYERKVKGMSTTAQTLIKNLQPYQQGLGNDHPLAIINEMDIADKHQDLLVVVTSVIFPRIQFSNQFMTVVDFKTQKPVASEAKNGAEVGRIVPLMGNMNVQVSTSFDVAFSKVGTRQNLAVVPTLRQLRDATADIISQFRGEFA
jgi:hypothetical protein